MIDNMITTLSSWWSGLFTSCCWKCCWLVEHGQSTDHNNRLTLPPPPSARPEVKYRLLSAILQSLLILFERDAEELK